MSRENAVDADELSWLEKVTPPDIALSEHHIVLPRNRWAIGRTVHEGTVWRIGDSLARERLFHPAWLWRDDEAFALDGDETCGVAPALPLRMLIRESVPLFRSVVATCQCLAATIAGLRRRRRPVAIVPPTGIVDIALPARHFALAVLTALPLAWRRRLRVSTLQVQPEPALWDLVFVERAQRGFMTIHGDIPQAVDDDLVASYLLDRLLHKDPEAVEAAAYILGNDGDDPWSSGIRAHLQGGVPGVSAVGDAQLDSDPEGAIAAVLRRLQVGAPLRGAALSDLTAVTARTYDPRPWMLLHKRDPGERSRALLAVLPHLDLVRMTELLTRAIAAMGDPGEAAGPWCAFLVGVVRYGPDPSYALELLSALVGGRTSQFDAATRASVWQEVTVALVERHEAAIAEGEVLSAAGRRIAADGGSASMVHGFLALPPNSRTPGAQRAVIDAVARAPAADRSLALLWRGLHLEQSGFHDDESPAHALLRHWARIRTSGDAKDMSRDELIETLRDTDAALVWGEIVAPLAPYDRLSALLRPAIPSDPQRAHAFFVDVELARAGGRKSDAKTRLEDIALYLPEAGTALIGLARGLLTEAMPRLVFPAPRIAEVATELAELEGASPVWMWLALTSQNANSFAEETIDGTVIAFCEHPPQLEDDRLACQKLTELLGGAPGWGAWDYARFIVRLCLAPDGDDTAYGLALANQLLRSVARRPDGLMIVTQMTREFLLLEPNHPALRVFLARLLPHAWDGTPPTAYLEAVRGTANLPRDTLAMWHEALGMFGT